MENDLRTAAGFVEFHQRGLQHLVQLPISVAGGPTLVKYPINPSRNAPRAMATAGHSTDQPLCQFYRRQVYRRMQASGLIDTIGLALVALDRLPRSPLIMTVYLLGLIAGACWILALAVADVLATRHFHQQQPLDQAADELRTTDVPMGYNRKFPSDKTGAWVAYSTFMRRDPCVASDAPGE